VAEPFLSEIRVFSFNFPPKGWAFCNGQTLPINQNQALFSLLGTTFGGDGRVNFKLPNLQGRAPIHAGSGFTLGEAGGESAHTVTMPEMPQHTHLMNATNTAADPNTGNIPDPGDWLAGSAGQNLYGPATAFVPMAPASVSMTGGSQPHLNLQPYIALNFCIALQGIFPSPN
jgi:microcystin-dependent protein